ncbi:hypothetical protein RJO15_20330 [Herbaspirillum huttiense F1]|uniref:hypothetical protein n=1 Tax=Herbaspirillum huttiense TaxID=863372 RepID=UPI0028872B41|nr:hypothetical protein [Herbaspirillum huttiense]MDT0358147.1 hypothetical protein [Herbaspirillum huttiense F1]
MKRFTHLIGTLAMATFSVATLAQNTAEHEGHHPEAASSASPAKSAAAGASMAQMDSQMKTMSDMHQKMMSAASLEERRQLMADHMKTMKDSMAMIQGMMVTRAEHKSAPPPAMMQKHMDMMQMTMQMMMDCMEIPTSK